MRPALGILPAIMLPLCLSGCITGAAGLAVAGASALLGAVSNGPGGAGSQGLAIDPNKALSDQLARAERDVSPSCKAAVARLEASMSAKGLSHRQGPAAAGGEPARAPGATGGGVAASDPAASSPAASGPAGRDGCALRYVCLAGARKPVQMMVCDRSAIGAEAAESPAPPPLAGSSGFGGGPGVLPPEGDPPPASDGATVPPAEPGRGDWHWAG